MEDIGRIKFDGKDINIIRYADVIILIADGEEKLTGLINEASRRSEDMEIDVISVGISNIK